MIRRPFDLYRAGVMDEYVMGLMNQVAQAMDDSITQEVTNHLFKKPGHRFGMDLVSLNMQRGREFGVPGYMEFRKFCGLPTSNNWEEMGGTMANETILRYQSIFEYVNRLEVRISATIFISLFLGILLILIFGQAVFLKNLCLVQC